MNKITTDAIVDAAATKYKWDERAKVTLTFDISLQSVLCITKNIEYEAIALQWINPIFYNTRTTAQYLQARMRVVLGARKFHLGGTPGVDVYGNYDNYNM